MAEQLKVFVSHSHQDNAFCQQIVQALRDAGADVWYDEHNLGWGELHEVIQRELGRRAIFVLILSKAVFASKWVKRETMWAYKLYDRDPTRAIVPVTSRKIDAADFDPETGWLFLDDFKRIEAPGYKPYRPTEAARRLLHALALTPAGEAPASVAPQPTESVDDLLTRGRALMAQKKYAEALPLFESALALDDKRPLLWVNKSRALLLLGHYDEALASIDRAVVLGTNSANIWGIKGLILSEIKHYDEALAAYDRALAVDRNNAPIWGSKGMTLLVVEHYDEALTACERALTIDPNLFGAWYIKAKALRALGRTTEADAAEKRARELGWEG